MKKETKLHWIVEVLDDLEKFAEVSHSLPLAAMIKATRMIALEELPQELQTQEAIIACYCSDIDDGLQPAYVVKHDIKCDIRPRTICTFKKTIRTQIPVTVQAPLRLVVDNIV